MRGSIDLREVYSVIVLQGDRLEGMSNSTGRGFFAYWSAVKQ